MSRQLRAHRIKIGGVDDFQRLCDTQVPISLLHGTEFGVGDVANLVVREVKTVRAGAEQPRWSTYRQGSMRAELNSSHDAPLPQLVQPMGQVVFVGATGLAQNFDREDSTDAGGKASQLVRTWR